jgi:LEA14-like dessication related protein
VNIINHARKRGSKWLKIGLFISLSFLLFESCKQPEAPEYYGFGAIDVNATLGQGPVLSTSLKFYNPNNFDVELKHAEVTVYLNDKLGGHSVLDSTILIPRKDTFYIPVSLKIDLSNLMSNALSFLSDKGVKVEVNGRLKMKKGALPFSVPIHYQGNENLKSVLQNF